MRTAILTDSNSGITVEKGKELNIFVIPMPVIIDGETYYESVDFTQENLYESLRQHRKVSSSQPSPGVILDMWDDIFLQGYEEIVYIPMSSGLSGTCHNAIQMSLEYDGRVQVVDNHRISVTLKQSVLDAKYLAEQGYCAKQIKEELERTAYDSVIYVTVDSLEQLKKGGCFLGNGGLLYSLVMQHCLSCGNRCCRYWNMPDIKIERIMVFLL